MKKAYTLIAVLAVLTMTGNAADIIARWTFDTRENLTVHDTTGKHNGSIVGFIDALVIEKGIDGNAYQFDEGKVYVEVPSAPGISVVNDFTFSCVIKPFDVAGYRTIFWKGDRRKKPEAVQYYLNLRDGKVEFKAKKTDGSWVSWVTVDVCTYPERWAAITMTFKDGICVIYVNGVKRKTNIPPDTAGGLSELVACDHPLYFGTAQGAGGSPAYNFRGLIDEIMIRNGTDIDAEMARIPVLAATILADTLRESSQDMRMAADESRRVLKEMERYKALRDSVAAPVISGASSVRGNCVASLSAINEFSANDLSAIAKSAGVQVPPAVSLPTQADVRTVKASLEDLAVYAEAFSARTKDLSSAAASIARSFSSHADNASDAAAKIFESDETIRTSVSAFHSSYRDWLLQTKRTVRESRYFDAEALFAMLPVHSGVTILRTPDILGSLTDVPEKAVITLARNEYEGFQLLLAPNPGGGSVDGVTMTVGAFTHSTGSGTLTDIAIAPMKTIDNSTSKAAVRYRGPVYDIIKDGVETYAIPAKSPLCAYVRIHADGRTKAGLYRGTITAVKGGFSRTVAVEVTVYDFTLPQKSALKVAFSFFEHFYRNWYGYTALSEEQQLSVYQFLMKYRITPNNIYSKDVSPSVDMLSKLPAANFCTLGYFASKKPLSDEELTKLSQEYGEKLAALKAAGVAEKDAYLYCYDEFGVQTMYDRDSARMFCERLRRDHPGIKLMQTSVPAPPFDKYFNVWVPPFEVFELMKPEYRTADNELWWYWVSAPDPFPSFDLGFPMHNSRMLMLLGFKYNIEGCLYWSINREWSDNVKNAATWVDGEWDGRYVNVITGGANAQCGQGNMVYPGPEGRIWPSLRFENMRDGIEDYDYCAMLKLLLAEIKSGKRPAFASRVKEIEALVAMPDEVIKSTSDWTKEPAVLGAYREKVARMIETITK
ncbi:MAG: LamG-like jellyroll fold domain-containing protein [Spirochaetota bacterium]